MMRPTSRVAAAALTLCFPARLIAETPLSDPGISDGETAVYRIAEGDDVAHFSETVLVTNEEGRDIYGITYQSDKETIEVRIQKDTMVPFSVSTLISRDKMTVKSTTHVSLFAEVHSEDILILSFTDLKYTLRGYPFGNGAPDLNVAFLNSDEEDDSSTNFEIKVKYSGVDKVSIEGRVIECYKLELKTRASGLLRVINAMLPKTYFWYSREAPHYLVAYEGSSGFPGSAKTYIKIIDYSGWE